jgi:hypothetical protein
MVARLLILVEEVEVEAGHRLTVRVEAEVDRRLTEVEEEVAVGC